MKIHCLLLLALLAAQSVSSAELTVSQTELRSTGTKELVEILRKVRTPAGKQFLDSSGVESIIGPSDSAKKSEQWKNATQRIYLLSDNRWLEVTYSERDTIFLAILVDGKKRELIWK